MRLLPLCRNDDPLLTIVRQRYGAQPVAVPRGGIELLDVLIEVGDGGVKPWGPLGKLVTGRQPLEEAVGPSPPQMVADLSGTRSGAVEIRMGLEILGAVLNAFGLPVPGISAAFQHSGLVSFKFSRVTKRSHSAALIGEALWGRRLRRSTLANALITEIGSALIIDSILESPDFSVRADKRSGIGTRVDFPAIQKIVASADVGVSAQRSATHEVSFQAEQPVVFGFTSLRLGTAEHGGLVRLDLGPADIVIRARNAKRAILYGSESRGLDPREIISTGTEEIHKEGGMVVAVGIPDGPLVVNAWPVELSRRPSLLVPDKEDKG